MAISPRTVRRRIKSVRGIKKITKAIELVSAAKMRRAVAATLASRPYAAATERAMTAIGAESDSRHHPLLAHHASEKTLYIVMLSDRGLCGGFNSQLLKAVAVVVKAEGKPADYIVVGKRGIDALRRARVAPIAAFTDLTNHPKPADAKTVADIVQVEYQSGKYSKVVLAYTDYRSALVQKPTLQTLLPISGPTEDAAPSIEYLFEPSANEVLETVLPRRVEVQLWQSLLESSASEHAARMATMRSATDAATDMIDGLNLIYNQARQSAITRELAEITAGKAAIAE